MFLSLGFYILTEAKQGLLMWRSQGQEGKRGILHEEGQVSQFNSCHNLLVSVSDDSRVREKGNSLPPNGRNGKLMLKRIIAFIFASNLLRKTC